MCKSSEYNVQKFNTLLAIKECNDSKIDATAPVLSVVTGLTLNNMKTKLSYYFFSDYTKRSPYYENKRYKGFKYSLSKKGKSVIEKYSSRMLEGHDLNIRKKPKQFDWSKVELLPGLHILEELKNESK